MSEGADTQVQQQQAEVPTEQMSAGQRAMATQLNRSLAASDPAAPAKPKPKPEDMYPKFLSGNGKPEMIALTSGHTTCVSDVEPTPLHPRFHRRAVEMGCMPEAVIRAQREAGINKAEDFDEPGEQRSDIIMRMMAQMVQQCDVNPELRKQLFTGDDKPDVPALSQRCGFRVSAGERDKCWDLYLNEAS